VFRFGVRKCLIEYLDPITADTRPGRCPHAQCAASGLPCSTEGNDTVCPWNYKCCPLTDGMKCFAPCPQWSKPCKIKCPFGLKVDPSPCTICECSEDPCLTRVCSQGAICIVEKYQPCTNKGKCSFTTRCASPPPPPTSPPQKSNNCPDYWPGMSSGPNGYSTCSGSDYDCPGAQKCCYGPTPFVNIQYCVDPCVSITGCALSCPLGLLVVDGCKFCQCNIDPCVGYACPTGTMCHTLSAPCMHYAGSPPCRWLAACM
jgi:hypothetical protein